MWFFRKKQNKLDEIEQKLNKSFLHIREDMSFLFDKINEQQNELKQLKSMMTTTELLAAQQEPETKNIVIESDEGKQDYTLKSTYETLTNIQKTLLLKLGLLLKESPGNWIPMKILTREMYPNKNYETVKSMISNYTDNLLNLGFIQKKRIGRQIVMTLTKKGVDCLPQTIKQRKISRKK